MNTADRMAAGRAQQDAALCPLGLHREQTLLAQAQRQLALLQRLPRAVDALYAQQRQRMLRTLLALTQAMAQALLQFLQQRVLLRHGLPARGVDLHLRVIQALGLLLQPFVRGVVGGSL